MAPPSEHPHQRIINALLQLAGFLTDVPHMPVPVSEDDPPRLIFWAQGTSSDQMAVVRQVAQVLNASPQWLEPESFVVRHLFGPIEFIVHASAVRVPDVEAPREEPAAAHVAQVLPEVDCPNCDGSGLERAAPGGTCPYCLGKGRLAAPWQPAAETGAGL